MDRNLKDLKFFSQYPNLRSWEPKPSISVYPILHELDWIDNLNLENSWAFLDFFFRHTWRKYSATVSLSNLWPTAHTNLGKKKSCLWLNGWLVAQILPKAPIFPWHNPCGWHGNNVGGCPATLWPAMSCMRSHCCRDRKKTHVYPHHIAIENFSNQRNIQSMYKAKLFTAICSTCGLDDWYFQCVTLSYSIILLLDTCLRWIELSNDWFLTATKTILQIHTRTYLSSSKNLCVREEQKGKWDHFTKEYILENKILRVESQWYFKSIEWCYNK